MNCLLHLHLGRRVPTLRSPCAARLRADARPDADAWRRPGVVPHGQGPSCGHLRFGLERPRAQALPWQIRLPARVRRGRLPTAPRRLRLAFELRPRLATESLLWIAFRDLCRQGEGDPAAGRRLRVAAAVALRAKEGGREPGRGREGIDEQAVDAALRSGCGELLSSSCHARRRNLAPEFCSKSVQWTGMIDDAG